MAAEEDNYVYESDEDTGATAVVVPSQPKILTLMNHRFKEEYPSKRLECTSTHIFVLFDMEHELDYTLDKLVSLENEDDREINFYMVKTSYDKFNDSEKTLPRIEKKFKTKIIALNTDWTSEIYDTLRGISKSSKIIIMGHGGYIIIGETSPSVGIFRFSTSSNSTSMTRDTSCVEVPTILSCLRRDGADPFFELSVISCYSGILANLEPTIPPNVALVISSDREKQDSSEAFELIFKHLGNTLGGKGKKIGRTLKRRNKKRKAKSVKKPKGRYVNRR